jgi:hypothetical protein
LRRKAGVGICTHTIHRTPKWTLPLYVAPQYDVKIGKIADEALLELLRRERPAPIFAAISITNRLSIASAPPSGFSVETRRISRCGRTTSFSAGSAVASMIRAGSFHAIGKRASLRG